MSVFPTAKRSGLLGRAVPRQRPVRRQTPLRQDPQGLQMARTGRSRRPRWPRPAPRTPTSPPNTPALRPRRGHKKALGAVKHSIIVACWHMLTTGELYNDLGGDYFTRRDPEQDHQAPRRPARTPRPRRHAAGGQRRVGLKRIFLSGSTRVPTEWSAKAVAVAMRDMEQRRGGCRSESLRWADRDHRRAAGVDGVDDLGVVDALEIDRGDAEVAVAELALDDDQRHALARQLDGVRVAQLVRRKAPPDTGRDRGGT